MERGSLFSIKRSNKIKAALSFSLAHSAATPFAPFLTPEQFQSESKPTSARSHCSLSLVTRQSIIQAGRALLSPTKCSARCSLEAPRRRLWDRRRCRDCRWPSAVAVPRPLPLLFPGSTPTAATAPGPSCPTASTSLERQARLPLPHLRRRPRLLARRRGHSRARARSGSSTQ